MGYLGPLLRGDFDVKGRGREADKEDVSIDGFHSKNVIDLKHMRIM